MKFLVAVLESIFGLVRRLLGAATAHVGGKVIVLAMLVFALVRLNAFVLEHELQVLAGLMIVVSLPVVGFVTWAVTRLAERANGAIANNPQHLAKLRERNKWQHLL